jgi:hypothetical protein
MLVWYMIYIGNITRSSTEGFVDLDYTSNLDRRRSLIVYVFTLSGYIISWKAILQSIVALSTTKAGYMELIEVVKKVLCLRVLVVNLGLLREFTIMHFDS